MRKEGITSLLWSFLAFTVLCSAIALTPRFTSLDIILLTCGILGALTSGILLVRKLRRREKTPTSAPDRDRPAGMVGM